MQIIPPLNCACSPCIYQLCLHVCERDTVWVRQGICLQTIYVYVFKRQIMLRNISSHPHCHYGTYSSFFFKHMDKKGSKHSVDGLFQGNLENIFFPGVCSESLCLSVSFFLYLPFSYLLVIELFWKLDPNESHWRIDSNILCLVCQTLNLSLQHTHIYLFIIQSLFFLL